MWLFINLFIFSEEDKIAVLGSVEEGFLKVLLSIFLNFEESRWINLEHSVTPIVVIFLSP
jgi:hypothetical protein